MDDDYAKDRGVIPSRAALGCVGCPLADGLRCSVIQGMHGRHGRPETWSERERLVRKWQDQQAWQNSFPVNPSEPCPGRWPVEDG